MDGSGEVPQTIPFAVTDPIPAFKTDPPAAIGCSTGLLMALVVTTGYPGAKIDPSSLSMKRCGLFLLSMTLNIPKPKR